MMAQILPALIMFTITAAVTSLLCMPMLGFPMKNKLVNFYWSGVWIFLMMISAIAGAMNTLIILDVPAEQVANIYLSILTVCFVIFVVFGWFRLSAKAITHVIMRLIGKIKPAV
ncbi:hypothetical protein [Hellea balneolensis]|uniref:hypothetical protein n=1 Tax=Hellea balneolensis TaxID=287478 RepID=UPI0004242DEF|nr:hypothetical protein [Hellea balneolensis]